MAVFEQFDMEHFIGEVRKYPEIWNVAAEEYHVRYKKKSAWFNVCRVFVEEFDKKDDREKNEIRNTLIKKWRNIKDNFVRSLKKKTKSGQAAYSGRRYIYARQLAFIQQAGDATDTQFSLGAEDEQDDLKQSAMNISTPKVESEYIQPPWYDDNTPRKRRRDLESSLIDFMNTPLPPSTVTAVPEPNPDRSFFDSILPSLSGFTEDKKLEFRSEVLNIIKRMRVSQQNISQQGCTGYSPNITPYRQPLNVPPFETSHCSHHSPQTSYHLSSLRLTEIGIRSHAASLPQAHNPRMNLQSVSPSTASSTCTELLPYPYYDDSLDVSRNGQ